MTFYDWLQKNQPLLAVEKLPEHLDLVRAGMELAWNAACEEAARAQRPMLRDMTSRGAAADACRALRTDLSMKTPQRGTATP